MTWPQAFFYSVLALLASPIVYLLVCVLGVWLVGWGDNGFWPFNRKNDAQKLVEALRTAREEKERQAAKHTAKDRPI